MLFAVGCNPDDKGGDDLTTEAAISLNIESASVTLAGGEVKVDVTSNAKWTVKASANDVSFNPASGEKNGSTTIVVPASTTPRTIEVTFTATKQHLVAGVELPDYEYATLTISQNATGEVVEGGIASITEEGDYEIENAWVVAVATQGFVMSDATGSAILVYTGSGASIPAIGTVVSVSGKVVTYNGKLQFDKTATVTPSSQTVTVNNGTPTEISTYAALDELKNNMVVKYVEMRGKLECKMSSKGYMNYNIYVEDHNGYDDWKGSVYSPVAEIATKLESWNGAYVIARGYSIYVSGTVYVNIVATDVELDASHPVLSAESITDVPAEGVQNATHNITVAALDNVTATPDGTIVTAASVSGNVLTYTVAANDSAAREGSIILSAAGVENVTVTVYQKGAGEEPEASNVYTSDAAFVCSTDNSTNKCYSLGESKINGMACSGVKFGTSSNAGFFTSAAVGVEGTKTLSFYGMAWKGKSATIYIKVEGSDEVKSVPVKANDGATGNPPYTITVTDADYYSVELTGLTATSKIMFSTDASFSTASSSAARAVLAGITLK